VLVAMPLIGRMGLTRKQVISNIRSVNCEIVRDPVMNIRTAHLQLLKSIGAVSTELVTEISKMILSILLCADREFFLHQMPAYLIILNHEKSTKKKIINIAPESIQGLIDFFQPK
jgi:hypothetical protein